MSSFEKNVPEASSDPPQIGFVGLFNKTSPPSYDEVYRGLNSCQFNITTNQPGKTCYEVIPVHLTRESTWLVCPYCYKPTMTKIHEKHSDVVDRCACFLCLIGWPCCLCACPYFVTDPIEVDHYCGECMQYVGMSYEDNPLLKDRLSEIRGEENH